MFLAKKRFFALYGIILFGLLAGKAVARYEVHLYTVAPREVKIKEILKKPINGDFIVVKGFIHERLGLKHYQFWDGADFIKIECYDRRLRDRRIKVTSKVEVVGEVEMDEGNEPVIKTKQVIVLSQ